MGALLLGLAAGLIYGWLINPVEFVDTNPQFLSQDYRTDIVLMTAEIYLDTGNLQTAADTLTLLFSQVPALTSSEALSYARTSGYDLKDLTLLENLDGALQFLQGEVSP